MSEQPIPVYVTHGVGTGVRGGCGACCVLPFLLLAGTCAGGGALLLFTGAMKPIVDLLGVWTTPVMFLLSLAFVLVVVRIMNRRKVVA
ncbi:MAG TPA: hypothetical protein VF761_16950 [Gemmatimonadaceae bacterium]